MNETINPHADLRATPRPRRIVPIDRLAALAILGAALSSVVMVALQSGQQRDGMNGATGAETSKAARNMAHGL